MRLWPRLLKRNPPKLYLGQLTVVPRTDFLRHFEGNIAGGSVDADLTTQLSSWLPLPRAPTSEDAHDSDLAIDVILKGYRLGQFMGGEPVPVVFWRPMVEIVSRVYFVKSGKDVTTQVVKQRMPWSSFIKRVLSWRFFSLATLATDEDMSLLLGQALEKMLYCVRAQL